MTRSLRGCLPLVLLLSACTTPAEAKDRVLISGVPHVKQKPDFCGEACAEMVLRKLGHTIDQDAVFNASGLDPVQGRGCHTRELVRGLKRIGFDVGQVWHTVDPRQADAQLDAIWKSVLADLRQGVPSILCMRYDEQPKTTEHFRLVLGYDKTRDAVIYHEPAEAKGAYRTMPRAKLFRLWPLKYGQKQWTVIRLRLKANTITAPKQTRAAKYAQHIRRLKQRLPHKRFHIVLQRPFVVVGDESAKVVRYRSIHTVKWAVDRLKAKYFQKDPTEIIDVWLFKNRKSYRTHAKQLFGSYPTTPFGYYTSTHRALVMNISTGGGTLVHEIVHPFMSANFPRCPSWFNEGLASLYEQCGDRKKRIVGFTNWRLAGLQKAIESKSVPSFETLLKTSSSAFYDRDPGTNYAQARYLCYYLQEKGKLKAFYERFRKDAKKDPTGLTSLKAVLKTKDLWAFKKRWEAFVLKLRYPSRG